MGGMDVGQKEEPRELMITLRPAMLFGAPTINGKRMGVEQVAASWWCNNINAKQVEHDGWPVANWDEVKICCWYMAEYGTRTWKKRYGDWVKKNFDAMWHSEWHKVPMPPQEEREKVEVG